jgi:hypothetical protein
MTFWINFDNLGQWDFQQRWNWSHFLKCDDICEETIESQEYNLINNKETHDIDEHNKFDHNSQQIVEILYSVK